MSVRNSFDPAMTTGPALRSVPRVLSIAGTDPSGGAGIQADLKSIGANGGYGMAVVTALVAQNTQGVRSVHTPPLEFLQEQLEAVSDDVAIDAVKIGMLADAAVIETVRRWLLTVRPAVVVLDPVMVATSGDRLLAAEAEEALRELAGLADLVTPNLPELAVLVNEPLAGSWAEAVEQGKRLSKGMKTTVLVKGGHFATVDSPDALVNTQGLLGGEVFELTSPRVATRNTHGTGCSLSSAMATVQAQTGDWLASLRRVKAWLQGALEHADALEVGRGSGPIHHFYHLRSAAAPLGDQFSREVWQETEHWREGIYELDFIRQLADGTLPTEHFAYYLAQDALYLNGYSRVLARASALAPSEEEQLFWASGARNCIEVEAELHRTWLSQHPQAAAVPGPVTKAYVDHLTATAAGGSYGELVAAVLPCYWLYAHVGETLHTQHRNSGGPAGAEHPYSGWLQTYADEVFAAATRTAVAIMDRAAAAAGAAERERMRKAFAASARYELEFFDAPRRHAGDQPICGEWAH